MVSLIFIKFVNDPVRVLLRLLGEKRSCTWQHKLFSNMEKNLMFSIREIPEVDSTEFVKFFVRALRNRTDMRNPHYQFM